MDDNNIQEKKEDIQWHPAFVVAMQGILIDYSDVLDYKIEHPMPTKSLRIDILVIKKRPEVVIKKQIAEIFRLENIFEYKSPTDGLNISEFHKALARTHVYKALSENVDIPDLTLSFVVTARPRELMRHLQKTLGYAVEEKHPGIFVVSGAMIPIQIINSKELSDDENLWLRNLNRTPPDVNLPRWIAHVEKKYGKRIDLSAYTSVILTANQDKLGKEDFDMITPRTQKILEEIGWAEKWRKNAELKGRLEGRKEGKLEGRKEGMLEGRKEGKLETAKAMLAEGDSLEKIARVTGISRRTLKTKLAAEQPAG